MKINDFVEWELQKFRDECNFSDEIIEFLQILYSNTDMQGERDELTKPLKSFIANLGER